MFGFRERRWRRLRKQPTPEAWFDILDRHVPYYRLLDEGARRELLGWMKVFLAEKEFEACGGLEMSEDVPVTIAAQACVLLLGRKGGTCFPSLKRILVYPAPYRARVKQLQPDGTVVEGDEGRLGESWHRGSLVLAWDAVRRGAVDVHDGHNVVFHEFAHQLDSESGAMEGTPRLEGRAQYAHWARVMREEYAHLITELEANHRTLMDRYGATNPAEFFAVATEVFFEKSVALEQQHPELYAVLAEFYGQDPAARTSRGMEPSAGSD